MLYIFFVKFDFIIYASFYFARGRGGGGSKLLNFGLLSGKEIPEKENADYELKCEANARAH